MKIYQKHLKTFALTVFIISLSCTKEAPELVDEQELITTVRLSIKGPNNSLQEAEWKMDAPNTSTIQLASQTQYEVTISIWDESDPLDIENITNEVKSEADEHQFFYEFAGVEIDFNSATSDVVDSQNNPLYVVSEWNTGALGEGSVQVYLIHDPTTKTSTNRAGFGGATDVQVTFDLRIE